MICNLLRLPDYWHWITFLIVGALLTCVIVWRRYLFTAVAIFSLMLLLAIAVLWPLSWNKNYFVGLSWYTPQPNSGLDQWQFSWVSTRGGLRISLVGHYLPPRFQDTDTQSGTYTLGWGTGDNGGFYPLWNDLYSITKSEFIQKRLGFQLCWATVPLKRQNFFFTLGIYSITVPHWFAMLLSLPVPTLWAKRYLRNRYRQRNNLCLNCGFSLVAHSPGGTCPECGHAIPPRKEFAKPPDAAKPAN